MTEFIRTTRQSAWYDVDVMGSLDRGNHVGYGGTKNRRRSVIVYWVNASDDVPVGI